MKANEDLQAIRKHLKADKCEQKEVAYASTISALNAAKKHTGE